MSRATEYTLCSIVAIGLFVGVVNIAFWAAQNDMIDDCRVGGYHRVPNATIKCEVVN